MVEMLGANYSPDVIASVNMETTYDGFRNYLENGPHGAVHQGVGNFGGDMGPQTSSPNGQSRISQVTRSILTFVIIARSNVFPPSCSSR